MQLRLQGQTQRSRRLWRRPHNGPRAALPSPSSPSSAREPTGPAVCRRGGASRRRWPALPQPGGRPGACCRACSRAILFRRRSIIRLAFTSSITCQGMGSVPPWILLRACRHMCRAEPPRRPHACASCMQSEPRTSGAGAGRAGALTLSLGARCFPSRRSCSIGGPQPSTAASPNGGPTPRPAGLER